MNDEIYTLVDTNRERANVARGAHYVRTHCGAPGMKTASDFLSKKERDALSGPCVTLNCAKPMAYQDFLNLPLSLREEYMKSLIENHHGTTDQIAALFGIAKAEVKRIKEGMDIRYPKTYDKGKWDAFISGASEEPKMSLDDIIGIRYPSFHVFDESLLKNIITLLNDEFDPGIVQLARYFGHNVSTTRYSILKLGFTLHGKGGFRMSAENKAKFEAFMEKRNTILSGTPKENSEETIEENIGENTIYEETMEKYSEEAASVISETINPPVFTGISVKIDNWAQLDRIIEILKMSPIHKGTEIRISIN